MSIRKSVPFLLLFPLFVLLILVLPAGASGPPESHAPRGPQTLPAAAAPRATKPFLERFVPVERSHDGADPGGVFGWIGANLGDLDGDGRNAYLLSAYSYQNFTGRVVVFDDDGRVAAEHLGTPGAIMGYSAAAAGDVNGDGAADYIVGAPSAGFIGNPGCSFSPAPITPSSTT